ncbi:unnamed protein product [Mytilus edulis]|uniref:Uncharacterized protein n=1 Tax=Mytilus edulis TaxID=6550 RepID=A0A8S3RWV7_MYTED|nr:unnamed protein product [Mytilus edulis]
MAYQTANTDQNKRVCNQTAQHRSKDKSVMQISHSYPPHTTKQESNGIIRQQIRQLLTTDYKQEKVRQLPNTDDQVSDQTVTHHTLQNKSNGISDSYLTQIKRQVSDGISDSYPPHTTKQRLPNTDQKRQVSDGISDSYPPHTTKQPSNGISDSYLTQIKRQVSDGIQTATHHILKQESNGKSDTQHRSKRQPPTTHYKQESNGKSDSYLTQIKRQVSDGISDSYPPHTTKQESNGISDSYLTQIKRQDSDGISHSYPPHTTKQESNGISDSY